MGHLIPAGTGFPGHREVKIISLGDDLPQDEETIPHGGLPEQLVG
jgi:hypothetical protein